MRKGVEPTIMYSRFKSYCCRCHYTIWKDERIGYEGRGKAWHMDCKKAILDDTVRELDPKARKLFGPVKKSNLKDRLEKRDG